MRGRHALPARPLRVIRLLLPADVEYHNGFAQVAEGIEDQRMPLSGCAVTEQHDDEVACVEVQSITQGPAVLVGDRLECSNVYPILHDMRSLTIAAILVVSHRSATRH